MRRQSYILVGLIAHYLPNEMITRDTLEGGMFSFIAGRPEGWLCGGKVLFGFCDLHRPCLVTFLEDWCPACSLCLGCSLILRKRTIGEVRVSTAPVDFLDTASFEKDKNGLDYCTHVGLIEAACPLFILDLYWTDRVGRY